MAKKQLLITLRRILKYIFIAFIGFSFLTVFTYIYDVISSNSAFPISPPQEQANANAEPTSTKVQPTPTPTISDYRTILLLVRATDRMLKYIEQVRAGDIDLSDNSVRSSYLSAFPIAIDDYNHASPILGMEHGWKNVTMVAQAYSLVYAVLQQGKMVSDNDFINMKFSRQWLINYQNTEEAVLSSRGIGDEFFSTEKLAVEQLLQDNYDGTPVPLPRP